MSELAKFLPSPVTNIRDKCVKTTVKTKRTKARIMHMAKTEYEEDKGTDNAYGEDGISKDTGEVEAKSEQKEDG